MMEICEEVVSVTTTGENASATGSAVSQAMMGLLLDVKLDFHASAPNTTDTVISDSHGTILTVANSCTDALIAPRQKLVDNANAAITNSHDKFALNGALTIALAGSNALTAALTATIRYLRF